jgi:diaminopimelate decarboxylase
MPALRRRLERPLDIALVGGNFAQPPSGIRERLPQAHTVAPGCFRLAKAGHCACHFICRISRGRLFLPSHWGMHYDPAVAGNSGQVTLEDDPIIADPAVGAERAIVGVAGPQRTRFDLIADKMDIAKAEVGVPAVAFRPDVHSLTASLVFPLNHEQHAEVLV